MIKPADINFDVPQQFNPIRMADLERDFDLSIENAVAAGRWPATVRRARDGATPSEVEATAEKYSAAGWVVVLIPRGDVRAEIHPPRTGS